MNKKLIIMAAALVLGLAGGAGMFMLARVTQPGAEPSEAAAPLSQTSQTNQPEFSNQLADLEISQSQTSAPEKTVR